jgi:hypothetical protein
MPFVAGRGDWPSALSRARGFGVYRSEAETLDRRSGLLGADLARKGGREKSLDMKKSGKRPRTTETSYLLVCCV